MLGRLSLVLFCQQNKVYQSKSFDIKLGSSASLNPIGPTICVGLDLMNAIRIALPKNQDGLQNVNNI